MSLVTVIDMHLIRCRTGLDLQCAAKSMLTVVLILCSVSGASAASAPNLGQRAGEIESLSPQDIGDYRAGKGMGRAKPTELNGCPGPIHVLERADQLEPTPEQHRQTEAPIKGMRDRAIAVGETLIAESRVLDRLFAASTVSRATRSDAINRLAELQGRLRLIHLDAHLAQKSILTLAQTERYYALRGDAGAHQLAPPFAGGTLNP